MNPKMTEENSACYWNGSLNLLLGLFHILAG
jgi:hypothetical protein